MGEGMNIFDRKPRDWRDLQAMVHQAFQEMGCKSFLEKIVRTARGRSVVDVYVKDDMTTPPSRYICECKLWSRRVPKSTVQQVRSLVQDAGATHGIIISGILGRTKLIN